MLRHLDPTLSNSVLRSPKQTMLYFSSRRIGTKSTMGIAFLSKGFWMDRQIKNIELQHFVDEEFDVLIAYYNNNVLELNQIVAMSKANLKVGIHNADDRLFDLIIEISINRFDLFKEEFKKYLTHIKQIIMTKQFIGTGVALVTPFNEDLSVDYDGLESLVEHNIRMERNIL